MKGLVEASAKGRLNTQRLQHEDAHPYNALLRWITLVRDCLKQDEDNEVVCSIGVDDE